MLLEVKDLGSVTRRLSEERMNGGAITRPLISGKGNDKHLLGHDRPRPPSTLEGFIPGAHITQLLLSSMFCLRKTMSYWSLAADLPVPTPLCTFLSCLAHSQLGPTGLGLRHTDPWLCSMHLPPPPPVGSFCQCYRPIGSGGWRRRFTIWARKTQKQVKPSPGSHSSLSTHVLSMSRH